MFSFDDDDGGDDDDDDGDDIVSLFIIDDILTFFTGKPFENKHSETTVLDSSNRGL